MVIDLPAFVFFEAVFAFSKSIPKQRPTLTDIVHSYFVHVQSDFRSRLAKQI
jgi:hypothetical protein